MADRGQVSGALLDGPLAFDNAISREAAETKGIVSQVAGDPDILVVPDLESGNMLAKQLTFLTGALAAGLVLGARDRCRRAGAPRSQWVLRERSLENERMPCLRLFDLTHTAA